MEEGRRHSRFLPADIDKLYREAMENPDLIEMSDHIALLEAKIQHTLLTSTDGDPVPRWKDVYETFSKAIPDMLGTDEKARYNAIERVCKMFESGVKWDKTWDSVVSLMEQLRKLTDTEVKRKKDLNQMIPIERVIVLMGELGRIVKRNVTNPEEIKAVYNELALLAGSNAVPGRPGVRRIPASITNLNPDNRGSKGGGSRRAMFRRKATETRIRQQAVIEVESSDDAASEEGN